MDMSYVSGMFLTVIILCDTVVQINALPMLIKCGIPVSLTSLAFATGPLIIFAINRCAKCYMWKYSKINKTFRIVYYIFLCAIHVLCLVGIHALYIESFDSRYIDEMYSRTTAVFLCACLTILTVVDYLLCINTMEYAVFTYDHEGIMIFRYFYIIFLGRIAGYAIAQLDWMYTSVAFWDVGQSTADITVTLAIFIKSLLGMIILSIYIKWIKTDDERKKEINNSLKVQLLNDKDTREKILHYNINIYHAHMKLHACNKNLQKTDMMDICETGTSLTSLEMPHTGNIKAELSVTGRMVVTTKLVKLIIINFLGWSMQACYNNFIADFYGTVIFRGEANAFEHTPELHLYNDGANLASYLSLVRNITGMISITSGAVGGEKPGRNIFAGFLLCGLSLSMVAWYPCSFTLVLAAVMQGLTEYELVYITILWILFSNYEITRRKSNSKDLRVSHISSDIGSPPPSRHIMWHQLHLFVGIYFLAQVFVYLSTAVLVHYVDTKLVHPIYAAVIALVISLCTAANRDWFHGISIH